MLYYIFALVYFTFIPLFEAVSHRVCTVRLRLCFKAWFVVTAASAASSMRQLRVCAKETAQQHSLTQTHRHRALLMHAHTQAHSFVALWNVESTLLAAAEAEAAAAAARVCLHLNFITYF